MNRMPETSRCRALVAATVAVEHADAAEGGCSQIPTEMNGRPRETFVWMAPVEKSNGLLAMTD